MNRAPVVTILGHVDHGKTTLLDNIRKSRIAAREDGGITQRIGGYEIDTKIKGYKTTKITFIDTPGHEAFSKLRARGANVADIAILIIDAVDSVMPQTIESIAHIKSAKIPFIIALNKTDLPAANTKKVKRDLLKYEVVTEEMGGDVVTIDISAKDGKGVQGLLETILLIAADIDLSYKDENPVKAYIIESKKDKRGVVGAAIIKDGNLKVGDNVYTNKESIKVRSLINDLGKSVPSVSPSTPFEMLGFSKMPEVGTFITSDEQVIKEENSTEKPAAQTQSVEELLASDEAKKKLSVILKADSHGALEAIKNELAENENIKITLSAVGGIHRSDIFLAKTTKSIVIGFSVKIDNDIQSLAQQEKVVVKTYNIIYELLEELEEVSGLIREKEEREKNLKAEAKVLATFVVDGQTAFGGKVTKGRVNLGDTAEIYRDNNLIGKTKLVSLQIRAKSVTEVKNGQDCGMVFSPALDIKVGDVVKYIL